MHKILVAGTGPDVGKTVVSAILTTLLQADYWKPVQCGTESDSDSNTVKKLIDASTSTVHPPVYSFKAPVSPHQAAQQEGRSIEMDHFQLPNSQRSLVIESVGGIYVPLTPNKLSIELFKRWECRWIVVSRHYIGSINHTLLTLEALKRHGIPILGLIFNGVENPPTEQAILEMSGVPFISRLQPEKTINSITIQRYANQWKQYFNQMLS
jgi:dethiobiotin synthetase